MDSKHIALITDDNYCLPTSVCIQSIINAHKTSTSRYIIHICSFNLSDGNIELFKKLAITNISVEICLFDKNRYQSLINKIEQKSHVTPTALIKFELANYFTSIDKLLYLDGDIIVKGCLDSLYDINIENHYLAASYEYMTYLNRIRFSLHRDLGDFYFNSGVMMLNLEKIRNNNMVEKLWDYKINKSKTFLMDQETLNAVFIENVYPLSIIWNCNPRFIAKNDLSNINKVYNSSFQSETELEESVNIIHYVGKRDKPWTYNNACKKEYWNKVYDSMNMNHNLQLVDYDPKEANVKHGTTSYILKTYGLWGAFCYCIYKLKIH